MAEEDLEDLDDLSGARMPEDAPVPNEEQPPQPGVVDRAQDLKDQFDQGKELYTKGKEKLAARSAKKAGGKGAKEGLKEGVEKQGAAAAKRKVATQGAQQVAKAGAKTAATTAVKAGATAATLGAEAATGPVGWVAGAITVLSLIGKPIWNFVKKNWQVPVFIIAGLLLLLAVPFGLLGGIGAGQYPANAAQKQQATLVASVGGDPIATRTVTASVVAQEKQRYANILNSARSKSPARVVEAQKKVTEINALMDQLITLSGDQRKAVMKDLLDKRAALISDFPEIFLVGGTCADTAQYIANGSISIKAEYDAQHLPEGKIKNINGQEIGASPKLCNLLVFLVKNGYKIGAVTLANNHTQFVMKKDANGNRVSTGRTSEHYLGRAADLGSINGESCSGGGDNCTPSSNWVSVSSSVMQLMRANKDSLGIWDSWGPTDLSIDNSNFTSSTILGHKNHIHLSVR